MFAEDGTHLATASQSCIVRLWKEEQKLNAYGAKSHHGVPVRPGMTVPLPGHLHTHQEKLHELAELGYKLFPLLAGSKHPNGRLAPSGRNDATSDPEKIKEWHRKAPMSNWGLATDGLLVIDIDGDASVRMNIGELETVTTYDLPVKVVVLNNFGDGMSQAVAEVVLQGTALGQ